MLLELSSKYHFSNTLSMFEFIIAISNTCLFDHCSFNSLFQDPIVFSDIITNCNCNLPLCSLVLWVGLACIAFRSVINANTTLLWLEYNVFVLEKCFRKYKPMLRTLLISRYFCKICFPKFRSSSSVRTYF